MIFFAGLISGLVDAIAGGGGLIMIPALMLLGLPVPMAIGTNKLCGTFGVLTSSFKFTLSRKVDFKAALLMGFPAAIGALVGSRFMGLLPQTWANPVVILLLFGITLFILFKPEFGMDVAVEKSPNLPRKKDVLLLSGCGFVIGFHDGFFGPGTGSFIAFSLICLGSLNFLKATGTAKVINLVTNTMAFFSFWLSDLIDFQTGIAGALGTILGSYLGASIATKKGAAVIRPIFLAVSFLIIGKLIWNQLRIQ